MHQLRYASSYLTQEIEPNQHIAPNALFKLGSHYLDQKKYEVSFNYFYQAVMAGNLDATYYLGISYYQGLGTDKDQKQAIHWLEKSAKETRCEHAAIKLGHIYKKNNDYINAKKWCSFASRILELKDKYLGKNVLIKRKIDLLFQEIDQLREIENLKKKNNEPIVDLARKVNASRQLVIGHHMTCHNVTIAALARKLNNLTVLHLGDNTTCNNETMAEFARKSTELKRLCLGNKITCNSKTMTIISQNTTRLDSCVLTGNIELSEQNRLQLFKNNPNLSWIRHGNKMFYR